MKTQREFKKQILILAFTGIAFTATREARAQDYNAALGVRLGWTSGVNVKIPTGGGYFDVLLGTRPYIGSLTVLYGKQNSLNSSVNIYYGIGGHVASINSRYYYHVWGDRVYYGYYQQNAIGIDGQLGLEIPLKSTPILLGLEIKPYMEFYGNGYRSTSLDPGIALRFKL